MYGGRATRSPSPANGRARSRSRSVVRRGKASSGMRAHDEHGNMIDDVPVTNFITSMDTLPTDEWRARTLAFESLIESLPKPNEPVAINASITPWFKSHTTVRRLFKPLSELLLDARSTVAKHTCQHLAFLVRSIRSLNPPFSDTCKYLLKDLLPSVLALHSQTVKVIKGYAFEMMNIIIPLCRFKSGLPVMLERLRKDKSRDVREACIKYLRLIIRHWAKEIEPAPQSIGGDEDSGVDTQMKQQQQEYLTPSICLHIGNGFARALMDQSQSVRLEARNAFEIFRYKYPEIWNQIVQKKDGILNKDKRLKKSIMNAAIKADAEGRSDLSNYYPSYDEGDDYDAKSIHSNESKTSWHSKESFASKTTSRSGYRDSNPRRSTSRSRPRTGGARSTASRPNGMNGLPKPAPPASSSGNNLPRYSRNGSGRGTRQSTQPGPRKPINDLVEPSPPKLSLSNINSNDSSIPTNPSLSQSASDAENKESVPFVPTNSSDGSDLGKEFRNGQNGQAGYATEVITPSTSSVSDQSTTNPKPNENYKVANQLLSAHKSYIDELMESLRTEMNTVREFEAALMQSKSATAVEGPHGPLYGPSDDDVLKYFETVYGFLEKGTVNGTKLRESLERVSRTQS